MTSSITSAPAKMFLNAPPQSGFGKVYRNNMNKDSFIQSQQQALKMLTTKSETALFYTAAAIRDSEELLTCKVLHLIIKILSNQQSKRLWTKVADNGI